jgi:hypothetical protein
MGLWLAFLTRAGATDVLVPDATPGSMSDFAVAGMVGGMVADAIRNTGVDVQDSEGMGWARGDADACFDVEECPANLWDRTDARMAVVMAFTTGDRGVVAEVRLHGAEQAPPIRVIKETVPNGKESAFAKKVAAAVSEILPNLPARGGLALDEDEDEDAGLSKLLSTLPTPEGEVEDLDVPAPKSKTRTKARDVEEEEEPAPKAKAKARVAEEEEEEPAPKAKAKAKVAEEEEEEPAPKAKAKAKEEPKAKVAQAKSERAPTSAERFAQDEKAQRERKEMGIPWWSYGAYVDSKLPRDQWLREARVHTGKLSIEANGGWGIGDVDRGYGVRVGLEYAGQDLSTVGTSTWEGFGGGGGFTGSVGVGYAPFWFLDAGVSFGIQMGDKTMNVGWECAGCDDDADQHEYDPVSAVQLTISPRVRGLPLATGLVKPYALAGATIQVYDGFTVPDEGQKVDYPDSGGGTGWGPTFGAGVFIDPRPEISIFVEVPYTLLVSSESAASGSDQVSAVPGTLEGSGGVLRIVAGVAVRL